MTADNEKSSRNQPSWRKPVGVLVMLVLILLWCGVAVTLIDYLSGLNFWLQLPVYVILGIGWIFPVKPMLLWMNGGSFRQFPENQGNGASDET